MSSNYLSPTPLAEGTISDPFVYKGENGTPNDYGAVFSSDVRHEIGVTSTGAGTVSENPTAEIATGSRAAQPWRHAIKRAVSIHAAATNLYPHLFDENEAAGQAVALISQARGDVQKALQAFGEAHLEAIDTHLKLVATAAHRAQGLSGFNKSFGALVGYVRRACLSASAADCSRAGLNILAQALQQLEENPTLTLMDAARWSEKLRVEGWVGDMPAVERLYQALIGDLELPPEQVELFEVASSQTIAVES